VGILQRCGVVNLRIFILSFCYNGLGFMKLKLKNLTMKELSNLIRIGLSYVFGNMFYHISLGLNKMLRYLLKSMGFRPKFVKYPKQKKDEDILGI